MNSIVLMSGLCPLQEKDEEEEAAVVVKVGLVGGDRALIVGMRRVALNIMLPFSTGFVTRIEQRSS